MNNRLAALFGKSTPAWDLSALLNAADPQAALPERHLWLIRLLEWLRHAPTGGDEDSSPAEGAQPLPALRLRHLLNVLDRNAEHRDRVAALLARFWQEIDAAALLADFGFSARVDLFGEIGERLRERLLPGTPATTDLAELFRLLFSDPDDAHWLLALDDATLQRLSLLLDETWRAATPAPASPDAPGPVRGSPWRQAMLDAVMYLASAVRAAGFSGPLRRRMSPELLADQPFRQLARVAEQLREHAEADDHAALLQEAHYLRALLGACQQAAASVSEHLEEHGVSVDLVFQVEQLQQRCLRIEELLTCLLAPAPERELGRLISGLVRLAHEQRSVRALFASHYSLLARKVAERSAETGEHYITRDRAEYAAMLRAAAGGGAVLAGTTFMKFFVMALGLGAFWAGFWAGANYAASFVVVQLLHWTVATKQPAMTAPAMAAKLTGVDRGDVGAGEAGQSEAGRDADAVVEGFVDEVTHLIRSQAAGIFGNLLVVAPLVLAVQLAWRAAFGAPLVGHEDAVHVLASITLLGPTPFYAAFTGVMLFASSLIAGWVENWFVWHRLDSALAWNPGIVSRLGAPRAQRAAAWWRANISGLASNISLGLLLGVVPVVAAFFGLPLDVRHVTLSTGQLAAAVGSEGFGLMQQAPFWWCVAGIVVIGVLNLSVSFFLAFTVALRSRGVRMADRSRIYGAIRRRLRRAPASFLLPPA